MTSPYSMSGYPQANYPQNYRESNSNSIAPAVIGATLTGAIGGGAVGYFKNRRQIGKDGSVSDAFVKEVFSKNLSSNASTETQNYFNHLKNILKKIDKAKTPEKFKTLIKDNSGIFKENSIGISQEAFLDGINTSNLKSTKESLKKSLENIMNFEYAKTRNAIKLGWDNDAKKFIKTEEFRDEKLFNIIKNMNSNVQWKKVMKYGGITGGILGALTLGYKILTTPRE